jgi:hypothetical protein
MKKLLVAGLMMSLSTVLGCGTRSEPGGPGAHASATTSSTGATTRQSGYHSPETTQTSKDTNRDITGKPKNDTFDIKVPALATTIKQGESKEVTVTLERSKDFKEDVTLKAMTQDKGLTISPSTHAVKATDANTDVKFNVSATKEATVGEHTITITGTPTTGAPTSIGLKVNVKGA